MHSTSFMSSVRIHQHEQEEMGYIDRDDKLIDANTEGKIELVVNMMNVDYFITAISKIMNFKEKFSSN
jgi:hypothetical protein